MTSWPRPPFQAPGLGGKEGGTVLGSVAGRGQELPSSQCCGLSAPWRPRGWGAAAGHGRGYSSAISRVYISQDKWPGLSRPCLLLEGLLDRSGRARAGGGCRVPRGTRGGLPGARGLARRGREDGRSPALCCPTRLALALLPSADPQGHEEAGNKSQTPLQQDGGSGGQQDGPRGLASFQLGRRRSPGGGPLGRGARSRPTTGPEFFASFVYQEGVQQKALFLEHWGRGGGGLPSPPTHTLSSGWSFQKCASLLSFGLGV